MYAYTCMLVCMYVHQRHQLYQQDFKFMYVSMYVSMYVCMYVAQLQVVGTGQIVFSDSSSATMSLPVNLLDHSAMVIGASSNTTLASG